MCGWLEQWLAVSQWCLVPTRVMVSWEDRGHTDNVRAPFSCVYGKNVNDSLNSSFINSFVHHFRYSKLHIILYILSYWHPNKGIYYQWVAMDHMDLGITAHYAYIACHCVWWEVMSHNNISCLELIEFTVRTQFMKQHWHCLRSFLWNNFLILYLLRKSFVCFWGWFCF